MEELEERQARPRRRLETKFEARTQKENETLDDYTDYFENYCSALDIEEEDMIKFFLAFLNTKSRRRAKMVKYRIHTWNDILTTLLRRGSVDEQKIARRKLEQKTYQQGEDLMDFAASCLELAQKAWPGDEGGAETFAIDYFIRGLPDKFADRAELHDSENIWELAQYVSVQAEKLRSREICNRNRELTDANQLSMSSLHPRAGYVSGITCNNCGESGHLTHQCKRNQAHHSRQPPQNQDLCYNCGIHGHLARNCPNRDVDHVVQVRSANTSTSSIQPDITSKFMIPTITVNNSKESNDLNHHYNNAWDDLTCEEQQYITSNMSTSHDYLHQSILKDTTIDGNIIRRLLLKPELQPPLTRSDTYFKL